MRKFSLALLASTALALPAYGQTAADTGKANPIPNSGFNPCVLGGVNGFCTYKPLVGPVSVPIAPVNAPWAINRNGDTISGTLGFPTIAALDMTYAGTPNPNALKLADGFAVSFCPALSCIMSSSDNPSTPNSSFFDHQRANLLFSGATQDDGHSEEQNLAVITTIATGYHKPYAASTAYNVGDNITIGNAVYRAVVAGTTGANSAPPGTRPTTAQGGKYQVADGSVTWQWVNDAAIDAKVGSYFETQVLQGAGSAWGAAFNYHIKTKPLAGMFLPGIEMDYSNDSGSDCGLGTTDCTALRLAMAGNNQVTEGLQVTGNDTSANNFSSIWAIRINGDKIASQSAIEVDASSPTGLGFGVSGIGGQSHSIATIEDVSASPTMVDAAGNYSIAAMIIQPSTSGSATPRGIQINGSLSSSALEDNSTSPASLNIGGKHNIGAIVDGSTSQNGLALNGTYAGAQIVGKNFKLDPVGNVTSGQTHTMAPDANHQFVINYDTSGDQTTMQSTHIGSYQTSLSLNPQGGGIKTGPGGLIGTLHTPASSSEACITGTAFDDANYHYVCVATNTWKRVALSTF